MTNDNTNIMSMFAGAGFGDVLKSITAEHNVTTEQLNGLGASILPLVKNAINNGINDTSIFTTLLGAAQKIDINSLAAGNTTGSTADAGHSILALISGGESNITSTIQNLATKSGITQDILAKILPTLSTTLLAAFMKQGGGLSSLISSFTTPSSNATGNDTPNDSTGGLMALANSFLDQDKDGSALDDIAGMLKKLI